MSHAYLPKILVQVAHKKGKPVEIRVEFTERTIESLLNGLLRMNASAYGRLMHYGQCRYGSKVLPDVKVYWFTLNEFDWDIISIMVNKELESHSPVAKENK